MEFLEIFTQMSWVAAMFLILGVVLIVIEAFVPGFGFWGISGSLCLVTGVIIRICQGLNLAQSVCLILIIILFFVVTSIIMVHSAKHGILGKIRIHNLQRHVQRIRR